MLIPDAAYRGERLKGSYSGGNRALALYNTLTKEQKDQIPQALRVWLSYRAGKILWGTPNSAQVETKIEIVLSWHCQETAIAHNALTMPSSSTSGLG